MENASNNLGKQVLGAVSGANYNNKIQTKANNNSPIKNALVTAGMGGALSAGIDAVKQANILKNKDAYIKVGEQIKTLGKDGIETITIKSDILKGFDGENVIKGSKIHKYFEKAVDIAKSGKFNYKALLKGAGITAALTGTLALILNLVKVKTPEKLQ